MIKLYPPVIDGTIPSFYESSIEIPYLMNRGVSYREISGFSLLIKTIQGKECEVVANDAGYDEKNNTVKFNLTKTYNIGQYYKVQLAYKSNDSSNTVGYYSTVGIIKYTSKPNVTLKGLDSKSFSKTLTGIYKHEDPSEALYSSCFKIYSEDLALIDDSGDIIHDTTSDTDNNEQHEIYSPKISFEENKKYYVYFIITTVNDLTFSSKRYVLMQGDLPDPSISTTFVAELDYDNGFIKLSFKDSNTKYFPGKFVISRACSKDNYVWKDFYTSNEKSVDSTLWNAVDFTVEQGVYYKYSIQQYNESNIYSDRIISNVVYSDFEDLFLYDGKRQLKVRFNPKVSSFKNSIPESKVDTLGSKYPFIMRHGSVNYKEFPIAGLISYQMDEANLFINKEDLGIFEKSSFKCFTTVPDSPYKTLYETFYEKYENETDEILKQGYLSQANEYKEKHMSAITNEHIEFKYLDSQTDLTSVNISAERIFKNEVLNWLTNGEIKLFRSPTEGNFIVRLMNTSLSPVDTLGRMLHSFQSTAEEIADFNFENLLKLDMFKNSVSNSITNVNYRTIDLSTREVGVTELPSENIVSFMLTDMIPGDSINIKYKNNNTIENIQIGATGGYKIDECRNIESISTSATFGMYTYAYEPIITSGFDDIVDYYNEEVPAQQFDGALYENINILETLTTEEYQPLKYYYYRFINRSDIFEDNTFTDTIIKIDDSEIDVAETRSMIIKNINPTEIYIGKGVVAEVGYLRKVIIRD